MWRRRARWVLVVVVLMLLVGALAGLVRWRAALPRTSGEVAVAGLTVPVRIARDAYGIAHVVAASEREAMLAQGFLHGQDRLFQMDLIRRAASGRLSELIGAAALPLDRRARRAGHAARAAAALERLDSREQDLLAAYAGGVNVAVASGTLPPEYAVLRVEFQPWEPVDVLLVLRAMQERLSTTASELTRYRLARRVGLAGARFILDSRLSEDELVLPDAADPPARETTYALLLAEAEQLGLSVGPPPGEASVQRPPAWPASAFREVTHGLPGFSAEFPEVGFGGVSPDELPAIGSNSWVVGASRTATGSPLLANDTHLGLEMPATFYLLDLEWPGHRVAGATVPGLPGIIIGRNRHIAWGVTILTADNTDYAIERVDPTDDDFYFNADAEGGRERFQRHTEIILVKGGAPVEEIVVRTRHGVVVDAAWGDDEVLVRARPEPEGLSAVSAVLGYSRATNFDEFQAAALRHDLPTENLVYADIDGHFGYVAAGAIPLRDRRTGLLPAAGWLTKRLFTGWDDAASRPVALDPHDGAVVSANNRVMPGGRSERWNGAWIRADRAHRARTLLDARETHDMDSFRQMQGDTLSRRASLALDGIRERLESGEWTLDTTEEGRRCWDILSRWDRRYESGAAPGLFALFWDELKRGVFADDVGENLARSANAGLLHLLQPQLFEADGADPLAGRAWWDDLRTPEIEEVAGTVIGHALGAAWSGMTARAGDSPESWDWPAMHRVHLTHPLGRLLVLDRLFNGPDVAVAGAGGCLLATAFRASSFDVIALPAMRMLVDLSPGGGLQMVLPSGQSGVPASSHYADLAPLWASVRDVQVFITDAERDASTEILVLKPAPATQQAP